MACVFWLRVYGSKRKVLDQGELEKTVFGHGQLKIATAMTSFLQIAGFGICVVIAITWWRLSNSSWSKIPDLLLDLYAICRSYWDIIVSFLVFGGHVAISDLFAEIFGRTRTLKIGR